MKARELPFDLLAEALRYPQAGCVETAERCREAFEKQIPDAAPLLAQFVETIRDLSAAGLEELYTRTFDLNPVCCLDLGWHLYGEDYERGNFLVRVRQELRRHGLAESTELPDHLTQVLPLLGRMPPAEAEGFARSFVLPALTKMRAGLNGLHNPYEFLLQAAQELIARTVLPATDQSGALGAADEPTEARHA